MDMYIKLSLKQGDALSPMLFNFALEYAIRRVQVNRDGLKLNSTHQLLAYADDVLGGSIHILKENAAALVAATREIGLEVSADKTKYMVMSRDQNAGRIVLLTQYCAGDKIEKNEMGWACGAYG